MYGRCLYLYSGLVFFLVAFFERCRPSWFMDSEQRGIPASWGVQRQPWYCGDTAKKSTELWKIPHGLWREDQGFATGRWPTDTAGTRWLIFDKPAVRRSCGKLEKTEGESHDEGWGFGRVEEAVSIFEGRGGGNSANVFQNMTVFLVEPGITL